ESACSKYLPRGGSNRWRGSPCRPLRGQPNAYCAQIGEVFEAVPSLAAVKTGPPVAIPDPPKGLSRKARAWWREIADTYVLESHHLALLGQAAQALDRIETARRALKRDGEYYETRFGERRAHPALAVANQASMLFAKLLRQLDLDVEPPPENHRR